MPDVYVVNIIEPTAVTANIVAGPTGPTGPAGIGSTFIFSQETPTATWAIVHNMERFPSVTVVDSAGTKIVGDVNYDNSNQVTLSFTAGFSGKAYLN